MEFLNWILTAITVISGSLAGFVGFMYRKQTKRFKNAEAFDMEVVALKKTIELLKEQVEWQAGQIIEVQKLVAQKDVYIEQIVKERHILELKHAKNKSAINCAYSCINRESHQLPTATCPVLIQRQKNEEEYVKEISKA